MDEKRLQEILNEGSRSDPMKADAVIGELVAEVRRLREAVRRLGGAGHQLAVARSLEVVKRIDQGEHVKAIARSLKVTVPRVRQLEIKGRTHATEPCVFCGAPDA
jgi:hypothetical protein